MAVNKPEIISVVSQIPGTSYTRGRASKISQISEHHIVGDSPSVIAKAKSAEFSCTFTISSKGVIYQLVSIGNTPYTDNDFKSNSRSITIEHAGGHSSVPYTEAMYNASIKLHAWLFQQYGELKCVKHRDIPEIKANKAKATACPGQLDVDRIVKGAKKLLKGDTEVKIGSQSNWRWRMNRLHRQLVRNADLSDSVFKSIVGKDAWKIVENWSSHAESDQLLKDQVLGEKARKGNWQGQIDELNKKLEAANAAAKNLGSRPTQQQYDELNITLQKCQSDAQQLAAQANGSESVEIEKPPSWFTRFLEAFSKKDK